MATIPSLVFYSWQSDLPGATNRNFIEKALNNAAKELKNDDSLQVEPVIDRDTAGVPGSPDISKTIFGKIDQAQVFVCDISIINQEVFRQNTNARLTPNPNVLLELGYALKSLGDKRIILVLNDVYGGPELLPFDLRMRRVLRYHLPLESEDRVNERKRLEASFKDALRASLSIVDLAPTGEVIQPISKTEQARTVKTLFAEQINDWTSQLLEEIRSRGHWSVVIRPQTFEEEAIPLSELQPLVRRSSFNIRGWVFPFIDERFGTGENWVGVENQWDRILEVWRLYQSGQFVYISGILDDWLDRSTQHPAPEGWKPGENLSVVGVVYRLTEIYKFASRLAEADIFQLSGALFIEVQLRNTLNRSLYDPGSFGGRPLLPDRYPTSASNIKYSKEFAREDIIAQSADLALQVAGYIFERFGWNPPERVLQTIQSEIRPNPLKTDE